MTKFSTCSDLIGLSTQFVIVRETIQLVDQILNCLIKRLFPALPNHIIEPMMNTFQYPDRQSIHLNPHKSTHNHNSSNSSRRLQAAATPCSLTHHQWSHQTPSQWANTVTQQSSRQQSSPRTKTITSNGIAEVEWMDPPIWVHTKRSFAPPIIASCNVNNMAQRLVPAAAWRV